MSGKLIVDLSGQGPSEFQRLVGAMDGEAVASPWRSIEEFEGADYDHSLMRLPLDGYAVCFRIASLYYRRDTFERIAPTHFYDGILPK